MFLDWSDFAAAFFLLSVFFFLSCSHRSTGNVATDRTHLHILDMVSKIQNYGILWHVSSIKSTVSSCHCEDRDANKLTQSVIAASSNVRFSFISRSFIIGCNARPVPLLKLTVILSLGFNALK